MSHFQAMETIFAEAGPWSRLSASVLTIGNFDGLHLGHRRLIQKLLERARQLAVPSVLMTFDPHPSTVLHPGAVVQRLYTIEDMAEQLEPLGVDYLWVEPFTKELSLLTPDQFMRERVLDRMGTKELVVGYDFALGHDRAGDTDFLKDWCGHRKIALHVIEPLTLDDGVVSSRRIRERVADGDVAEAARLLGRPFSTSGTVRTGDHRGAPLGFPTANLTTECLLPANGVYITEMEWQGQRWPSVTNVGVHPTINEARRPIVETHVLDFSQDLYDQQVRVHYLERLRPEQKFASLDELKRRIAADVATARQWFSGRPS